MPRTPHDGRDEQDVEARRLVVGILGVHDLQIPFQIRFAWRGLWSLAVINYCEGPLAIEGAGKTDYSCKVARTIML